MNPTFFIYLLEKKRLFNNIISDICLYNANQNKMFYDTRLIEKHIRY